jgi:hypothetical protein
VTPVAAPGMAPMLHSARAAPYTNRQAEAQVPVRLPSQRFEPFYPCQRPMGVARDGHNGANKMDVAAVAGTPGPRWGARQRIIMNIKTQRG